jgi:hypothetical protein
MFRMAAHHPYRKLGQSNLTHPKLEGFRGGEVTLNLLEAHINRDNKEVRLIPHLVLQKLV